MFCSHCGKPLEDGAQFCSNCSAPVEPAAAPQGYAPQAENMPPYGAPQPPYPPYGMPQPSMEPASLGLRVLCWFIPILGIVLYFIKKDEKPVYAKQCGKAALISILVNVAIVILSNILLVIIGTTSSVMYY